MWFFGLTLLVIGSAIALNTFTTPGKLTGATNLQFNPAGTWCPAYALPFHLVKGDELTVIVDPNYPAISHYIRLEKAGSDWVAEKVLEGQGAWVVKAPVRGVYVLIIEGTVVEEAPEGTKLLSSITFFVKCAPRSDLLEAILFGAIIPGLVMIVASIYFGGKES